MRADRSGVLDCLAYCVTCGWESQARNAVGNAAQHAERTGHNVKAEQTTVMIWNP